MAMSMCVRRTNQYVISATISSTRLAHTLRNPFKQHKTQGKWSPPMIENPAYKGEWKPRQIRTLNFESSFFSVDMYMYIR